MEGTKMNLLIAKLKERICLERGIAKFIMAMAAQSPKDSYQKGYYNGEANQHETFAKYLEFVVKTLQKLNDKGD
jgi:hypothetical protein